MTTRRREWLGDDLPDTGALLDEVLRDTDALLAQVNALDTDALLAEVNAAGDAVLAEIRAGDGLPK